MYISEKIYIFQGLVRRINWCLYKRPIPLKLLMMLKITQMLELLLSCTLFFLSWYRSIKSCLLGESGPYLISFLFDIIQFIKLFSVRRVSELKWTNFLCLKNPKSPVKSYSQISQLWACFTFFCFISLAAFVHTNWKENPIKAR